MKKFNKKGFTIVELVIVIAVIGILAGVLIPTFSSITQKAQQSAALQEATAGRNAVLALTNGVMPEGSQFYVGELDTNSSKFDTKFIFKYEAGAMEALEAKNNPTTPRTDAKEYTCYIAASQAIEPETGAALLDGADNKYALAIAKLAGYVAGEGVAVPDVDLASDNSHFTITFGDTTVNVYWTSDVKDSLIIFLGGYTEQANS